MSAAVISAATMGTSFTRAMSDRYRRVLGIYVVLAYYSGITMFLGKSDRPTVWAAVFALLCLPLFASSETWRALTRSPIVAWVLFYLIVVLANVKWERLTEVVSTAVRLIFFDCETIVLLVVVFSSPVAVLTARRWIAGAVVFAVAMNVYDLLSPGLFSVFVGRGAGFYMNPNTTAAAIILGVILSIDVVPQRWRGLFMTVASGGVLMTQSRAGMMGCLLVVIGLIVTRRVRMVSFVASTAMTLTLLGVALIGTQGGRRLVELAEAGAKFGAFDRILNPEYAVKGTDFSTTLRLEVLRRGLELFKKHPFFGAGFGATTTWQIKQSTHDIYIRHLAEFGIVGVVLFPLLIFSAIAGAQRETRSLALLFAVYLLLDGFFSHNILEERNFLVAYALMSAIAWESLRARVDMNHLPPALT